jgi:hypothetical protein
VSAPAAGAAPIATAEAARRRSDDRLALAAIVTGAATALLGVHAPLTLSTGLAIGLSGVLLAVRGDRRVPAPRLMALALAVALAAVVGAAVVAVYEDWEIGQRLAEGAPLHYVTAALRPFARAEAALRSLALFSGLSLLLGAGLTRWGSSGK